jgi:Arc/MetJ family transcription regulator
VDIAKFAIQFLEPSYTYSMPSPSRRKTSFEIDTAKVNTAKEVLGTKTLTDTVDAALAEVIKLRQRRQLVELLFRPGALALNDPETTADAWR